jgi:4-diphosphocytidyl-2-C-methyl-D-erythritol kinase
MISFPNAKINLGLHVIRKRDDGFHDIETVFFPVPLCDTLEIYSSSMDDASLNLYGAPLSGEGDNLCMKAYKLLKREFDLPPVEMHLLKHIPAGAGLGGGSSDAAQTLIILNDIFKLDISFAELERLAVLLGSDCPFFIRNKPVFAFGKGEQFEDIDLDLSGKYIKLVKPDIHISTPSAYAMIKPVEGRPSPREIIQKPIHEWRGLLINDFEEPIFKKYPEIKSIRDEMYQQGAVYASMSGSGSAVYGIFNDAPSINNKDSFFWQKEL